MEAIGEVRLGPIMTIFAISTRMNAGKPASAGDAFSTAFSWSAVYGFDGGANQNLRAIKIGC